MIELSKEQVVWLFENYKTICTDINMIKSTLQYMLSDSYVADEYCSASVKMSDGSGGVPSTGTHSDKTSAVALNSKSKISKEIKGLQKQARLLELVKKQMDCFINHHLSERDNFIFVQKYIKRRTNEETITLLQREKAEVITSDRLKQIRNDIIKEFIKRTRLTPNNVEEAKNIIK